MKSWFNRFFYSIIFIFVGCVGWLSLSDEHKVFLILSSQTIMGRLSLQGPVTQNTEFTQNTEPVTQDAALISSGNEETNIAPIKNVAANHSRIPHLVN